MELCEKEGADLDKIDFYHVDIEMAFQFFIIGSKLIKDLHTLQRIVYECCEDYSKQNTRYLELRSTPKCYGDKTKIDYIKAVVEAMEKAEEDFPKLKVRFLLSINRSAGVEAAQETIDILS